MLNTYEVEYRGKSYLIDASGDVFSVINRDGNTVYRSMYRHGPTANKIRRVARDLGASLSHIRELSY